MLIDCYMESYIILKCTHHPDGFGGYINQWEDGETIKAAVVRDTSVKTLIAEAAGAVETYTVTTSRAVQLPFHTVIRRLSDNKAFRITSDNAGKKTPACAALDIAQCTAEPWCPT